MSAVSFQNLSKTFPDGTRALRGVDLEIAEGEFIALVGPSGCGKTTLLGLIGRLHDATEGVVSVDGVPIRDLKLSSLRGALSYVPQDSFLFSDTYRNNLLFGADEHLEDEELKQNNFETSKAEES